MGVRRVIGAICLAACALAACDEGAVRVNDPSIPAATQPNSARVTFPAEALAKLYELESPDGFELLADPFVAWTNGTSAISFGPIQQFLAVASRQAEIEDGVLVLTSSFRDVSIPIPVRVQDQDGLRICRYRVRASALQIIARVSLDSEQGRFQVSEAPTIEVQDGDLNVTEIGGCTFAADAWGDNERPLGEILKEFVLSSLADSAAAALSVEPLPYAGIVTGRVELDRRAPFSNRRGTIAIQNDLRANDGLVLDADGLQVALELGVAARRAGCAPPVEIPAPGIAAVAPADLEELRDLSADFALTLSNESLSRILQALTLAGFACQGLEDSRPPETNEELIPSDDIRLGDLGLQLPIGPWVRVVASPGALPEVRTRPWAGDLQLTWEKLTLEFYGEVDGAPVRLATLTANTRAALRPRRNTVGFVRLDIDAIDLSRVSFDSPWLANEPGSEELNQWAQRALLLILSQQFVLPLPLQTNVRVAGTQIRDDDIALYLVLTGE